MKKIIFSTLLLLISFLSYSQSDLSAGQRFIKVGNTLREAQQMDEAEDYLNKGLAIVKQNTSKDAKYWEAVADEYLAMLYKEKDENNESIKYFTKALNIYTTNGYSLSARALQILLGTVQPTAEIYGGIDVGAKGVKLSIVSLTLNRKGENEYKILKSQTINPEASSGTDAAFKETAKAVQELIDTLKNRGISESKTFVVISSGLYQTLHNLDPAKVDQLVSVLKTNVRNYSKDIPALTPEQEGELGTRGVLPARFLHNSISIDIGSGNTKGGYVTSDNRFESLSFPYGTTTVTTAITKSNTGNLSFGDAGKRYYDDKLKGIVQPEMSRKPGVKNSKNAFMMGGIVWAMITYLYPQKINEPFVEFTIADVRKFKKMAIENYDGLISPNLDALDNDPALKMKAQSDITSVKEKTFNQENIIAGAILFEGIMNEMDKTKPLKTYYFPRYGVVGWITRYVTKSVSDELKNKND